MFQLLPLTAAFSHHFATQLVPNLSRVVGGSDVKELWDCKLVHTVIHKNLSEAPFTWRKVVPCKRSPSQPSQLTYLSERLYEKKVDPFARVDNWLSNDNRARACSDRLALTEGG